MITDDPSPTRTAYHEAGHAVAAWIANVKVVKVSILPYEIDFGGWGTCLVNPDNNTAEELVMQVLGGPAADRLRTRHPWTRLQRANNSDWIRASEWLDEAPEGTSLDDLWLITRKLLALPRNWAAVEALASVLLEQREVDGEEACGIIHEITRPDLTPPG